MYGITAVNIVIYWYDDSSLNMNNIRYDTYLVI